MTFMMSKTINTVLLAFHLWLFYRCSLDCFLKVFLGPSSTPITVSTEEIVRQDGNFIWDVENRKLSTYMYYNHCSSRAPNTVILVIVIVPFIKCFLLRPVKMWSSQTIPWVCRWYLQHQNVIYYSLLEIWDIFKRQLSEHLTISIIFDFTIV